MAQMLQLRAWLVESEPEIWRRLVVDPRLTMEQLHTVLQHAFGWTNSHMHQFHEKDGRRYATPAPYDDELGAPVIDERKVCLAEVFDKPKKRIAYEYDFGDSWIHAVQLEKHVESEAVTSPVETLVQKGKGASSGKPRAVICIAGERSGPPEDCGGLGGFYDLLEIKQKPPAKRSADDREMLQWLGDWDAQRFLLAEVNELLGRVRVRKGFQGR